MANFDLSKQLACFTKNGELIPENLEFNGEFIIAPKTGGNLSSSMIESQLAKVNISAELETTNIMEKKITIPPRRRWMIETSNNQPK